MKKLVCITFILFSSSIVAFAQKTIKDLSKSPLVMVMAKSSLGAYPISFEETDSSTVLIKNGDTTRTEYFYRYTDRRYPISRGVRKTKIERDKISIWINDTLRIEVKRQAEVHNGTIGGKKGKIERLLIPSTHPAIAATEQYMLQGDSSMFIVYRPELGLIELESFGDRQYRRMIGNMFTDLCSYNSGGSEFKNLNRNLKPGDELQILYSFETLNEQGTAFTETPNRLMTVILGDYIPKSDPQQIQFKSQITDLEYATIFDETSSVIELYSEGFALNYHLYLKDSLYNRTLKIYPPDAPIKMHPFYPSIDLAGPLIEATYERNLNLADSVLNITSYWNSADGTRINFIPEFAFPWLDNGENFVGTPIFMNLDGKKIGKPYQVEGNKKTHFSRIQSTQDSLYIEVYSPEKQNITIELQQLNGQTIQALKQSYGLKKGVTQIPFANLKLPYGSKADLVLLIIEKGVAVEQQRFRYTQLD